MQYLHAFVLETALNLTMRSSGDVIFEFYFPQTGWFGNMELIDQAQKWPGS